MDKLDAILKAHVAHGDKTKDKLLGASFVVANKDGIVYSGSAGRIHVDVDSPPFDGDSFTLLASLTKLVTVTCVMQLVERGMLKLDDDMRPLVPQLAAMQILKGFDSEEKPILEDNLKPITLRNLLTHTVGLGYDIADPDLLKWSKSINRTDKNLDWSKAGFTTPLKFAPGEGWFYGSATDWAGQVLEAVTGKTLGEYMRTNIFEPLGMKDATFWPGADVESRTLTWAYRQEDGSLKAGPAMVPVEHEIESGGAGLYASSRDYGTFLQGLLAGELVKEETLAEMFSPQLNEAQSSMLETIAYHSGVHVTFAPEFPLGLKLNHGLGGAMNMEDVPGKRRKGSMMWSGMCNSRWWIDRETGIGAVLFVNVSPHGDPVLAKLYNELEQAVYSSLDL